ncbi:MAG: hypothetical protein H7Y27_06940 [Gemmatimonadaceae bacterium]|nr:hypothetical protein [Chitinophagaceae bacterium]
MKKFLTGFLALFLAIGFSAFTAPEQKKESQNWYLFVGDPESPDVFNPYSYERQFTIPNCLPLGGKMCAVRAERDLSEPLLDIPDLYDPDIYPVKKQ